MWKIIKSEFNQLLKEIKSLDKKAVTVFISSIIMLTISWYFSNPEFFRDYFSFIQSEEIVIEELISFLYWFIFDFILFFVVPFYIIKLIFKENLSEYGALLGNKRLGLFFLIIAAFVIIPIIIIVSNNSSFTSYFPLMNSAVDDWKIFLVYELVFIAFIFSWEFIFRGFMLFGLEKKFGIYSVFIQMIPFVLLHSGKPFIETFASIFGGLFLGYLALRTRSMIYGFLIHAIILIALDIIAFIA